MPQQSLSWAVPVMRVGYSGRGLVYLVVAGFSLYAIWRGGQAKGTSSALSELESTGWGTIVLLLILVGLVAFALWRALAAIFDLEERGADAKGLAGRGAMIVSGLVNLGLAILAFSLLFVGGGGGSGEDGGSSSLTGWLSTIMQWPGGRWVVGLGGAVIAGFGVYYGYQGWSGRYRRRLKANHFTTHWNWFIKAGVIAKGIVIIIIGGLFIYAALRADPQAAGGTGDAFAWLTGQPYGRILVGLVCVGLLAFAGYCLVNAAYRIVPKVSDDTPETLEAWFESARQKVT